MYTILELTDSEVMELHSALSVLELKGVYYPSLKSKVSILVADQCEKKLMDKAPSK